MANFFKDYSIKIKAKQALDSKFNPTELLNSVVNNKGVIDRTFPTAQAKVEKPNYKSMKKENRYEQFQLMVGHLRPRSKRTRNIQIRPTSARCSRSPIDIG